MFSKIVMIVIVVLFSIVGVSNADDLETVSFISPENSNWVVTARGHFSKPGIVQPNETIFSVSGRSTEIRLVEQFTYRFIGRTGDRTFELQYKFENFPPGPKRDEKISMYFDETLYHLGFPPGAVPTYSGCTREQKVFLKMIKLEGNQLEYQIILPDCLRRNK